MEQAPVKKRTVPEAQIGCYTSNLAPVMTIISAQLERPAGVESAEMTGPAPHLLFVPCTGGFADSSIHVRQLQAAAGSRQQATESGEAGPALGSGTSVLRGHTGAVTSLSHSPCSQLLASGSADCSARLWSPSLAAGLAAFRSAPPLGSS